MHEPPLDIERVVREVLAELGVAPQADGSSAGPASAGSNDGELVVDRRVVTMAELPERLDGIRRVVVLPGAVITPSVRDELTRRRVELVRAKPQAVKDAASVTAVVVSLEPAIDPAPLAAALEHGGFVVQARQMDCLIRASEELAKDVTGGRALGVLLTRHAAAAVCLANRQPGLRAIRGTTSDAVAADAAAVGANVLIVDTSAAGFFPTRQMVARFLRGGVRECPEPLRKRLE